MEVVCRYCTGSTFTGNLDDEGKPSGYGRFRFPNGIEYHGQFKSGVFHGQGMLVHPTKFKMCGKFVEGKCIDYELYFSDGLEYTERNWKYCQNDDRRFWQEIVRGIPPVGKSFLTKDKPHRPIPRGVYDAEEGFYDPGTGYIYDAQTYTKKRYICPEEQRYILQNYRMNEDDFAEQEERRIASKIVDVSTDSVISDDELICNKMSCH